MEGETLSIPSRARTRCLPWKTPHDREVHVRAGKGRSQSHSDGDSSFIILRQLPPTSRSKLGPRLISPYDDYYVFVFLLKAINKRGPFLLLPRRDQLGYSRRLEDTSFGLGSLGVYL